MNRHIMARVGTAVTATGLALALGTGTSFAGGNYVGSFKKNGKSVATVVFEPRNSSGGPQFTDVIDSAKDGHSIRAVTYDATTGKRRNTCETSSVKDCEISPRIAKGHKVRVKVYWVKGRTATYLGTVTTAKGKLPVV
ncbi:hypothetical protein [Streptomyces sp. NPDC097610]|uniref:hypothetical protein n=1 Tax=Streptomyces sp. NPDC097610 TaxID=3157227 RepID=UPI003318830A